MSQKSPFEVRLDVLSIAKDYMDKQYAANKELAERMIAAGQQTIEEVQEQMKMYTPEDLLKQAEEMYTKFVANKEK